MLLSTTPDGHLKWLARSWRSANVLCGKLTDVQKRYARTSIDFSKRVALGGFLAFQALVWVRRLTDPSGQDHKIVIINTECSNRGWLTESLYITMTRIVVVIFNAISDPRRLHTLRNHGTF
jgi:hypothetical protein